MAEISISDRMKEKQLLSFEVFPPKTDKGMNKMPETLSHLGAFHPDYISCTYGAGGSNVGANRAVCRMIAEAGTIPVTHFTVIRNSKESIKEQLQAYLDAGVDHVLALRGDLPAGQDKTGGDFQYATELIAYIRDTFGDRFEIAAGGAPEGHVDCPDFKDDIRYLKWKQENGASYIMTQLCWDMEQFKRWLDQIRSAGITIPVDVGVMPILDEASTINMSLSRNGCVMDRELSRLLSRYWIFPNPFAPLDKDGNPVDSLYEQKRKDFREAGIEYTIRQIEAYRACGIDGIHLYTMNKWEDVSRIVKESGLA